jgi:hypothetical protein
LYTRFILIDYFIATLAQPAPEQPQFDPAIWHQVTQIPFAPLPPRWKAAYDKDGFPFYYHIKKRVPQWVPPPLVPPPGSLSSSDESSSSSESESAEESEEEDGDSGSSDEDTAQEEGVLRKAETGDDSDDDEE